MKSVDIVEVNSKKDLQEMLDLPWKIYSKDPHWIPPLKMALKEMFSKKHPFYKTSMIKCWVAKEEGVLIGRIIAIINDAHNKFHDEKCGFFGFFECPNNQFVANSLLAIAEKYLRQAGMEIIRGPVNPSTNYECGTLVEGFDDPPQIMMTYNPPYHRELIEKCGYQKAMDLMAYQIDPFVNFPEIMHKITARAERSNSVTYRRLNKSDWKNEVALMHEIYNDAWEKNWGFIPMSTEEFYHTAKDLKSIADERLMLFAFVKGQPAGFVVCLPDYNQVFKEIPNGKLFPFGIFKLLRRDRYVKRARVITLGIKGKYKKTGLATLLYKKIQDEVKAAGFHEVEMSWVLEDNKDMNKPLLMMGAKPYKRYRLFEKSLQP